MTTMTAAEAHAQIRALKMRIDLLMDRHAQLERNILDLTRHVASVAAVVQSILQEQKNVESNL